MKLAMLSTGDSGVVEPVPVHIMDTLGCQFHNEIKPIQDT